MSAQIIWLCDRREQGELELPIDVTTAIDAAIRDIEEIKSHWGSELALERLLECQELLRRAYAAL